MTDNIFHEYVNAINRLLKETGHITQGRVADYQETNTILYSELLPENYKSSFANPDFATEKFGQLGALMSALYYEFRKSIDYGFYCMSSELEKVCSVYRKLTESELSESSILPLYTELKRINDSGMAKIENDYTITDRYYRKVAALCRESSKNIYRYNQPVSDQDIVFMQYINAFDEGKIIKLANHIGNMLLHGFISQGRDPGMRRTVVLYHEVGQERVVQYISRYLKNRVQYDLRIVKVASCNKVLQYEYDHQYDVALILDHTAVKEYKKRYQEVVEDLSLLLGDQCGRIKISQFGSLPDSPEVKETAVKLTEGEGQVALYKQFANIINFQKGRYVNPGEISLCSVTIPNQTTGGDYDEVFEDFYRINTTDSEPYELLQQILIDEMDRAVEIEVEGAEGNDTNMCIRLQPLKDLISQTNFMNCGGDINIPHGEVFTTPQLEGTNGLLHFKSVFLKGYHYNNLRLHFVNGFVEEYSCQNFDNDKKNREYVLNTLFDNCYPMPIGEFSIGTNTAAYAVISKHGLLDKLPILLVEKLGPHFAIGDPCYARGEEEKVFNIENGKEIMPKENSQTGKRYTDPDTAYTNVHTDITIPYEEIASLTAVHSNGKRIDIIKDGIFVLPGLDELNKPLLEMRG